MRSEQALRGGPVIGIMTYGRGPKNHFTLPAEYVDSVRRAGGVPLLVPPGDARLDKILHSVDGLIFTGGGDLDPLLYGGRLHETVYMVDAERDTTELDLARRIVETGMPTLAICRGTQILNVAFGGTLFEHLPEVVGEAVLHRAPPREPISHSVRVRSGSRLASIVKDGEFSCASWHHQSIRNVAPGFEVVAHAPDGTIEGVEMDAHPWLLGVQWHPELTAAEDVRQQSLFDAFVRACGSR